MKFASFTQALQDVSLMFKRSTKVLPFSDQTWLLQYCTREEFDLEALSDLLPQLEEEWISLSSSSDSVFWQVGYSVQAFQV